MVGGHGHNMTEMVTLQRPSHMFMVSGGGLKGWMVLYPGSIQPQAASSSCSLPGMFAAELRVKNCRVPSSFRQRSTGE